MLVNATKSPCTSSGFNKQELVLAQSKCGFWFSILQVDTRVVVEKYCTLDGSGDSCLSHMVATSTPVLGLWTGREL